MGNKITRRCSTVDERYTRPQGLYPQRDVDQKKLRRLILDSKLAPCFPGEEETSADFEECPICFLYYPSLNRSKCCSKGVCTECFLQMKSPRAARATQCPFCKSHNYAVEYRGSKSLEEKGIEAAEEQKFIEAKIRMRKQEILDDEEREHRKEEGRTTPTTLVDEHETSRLVELPESRSSYAQQVKLTPVIKKWKQNLYEPSYCSNQLWLRKPCGPSLTAGPSSFRTCGPHCEPNCSKCLLTFHKRRVYDMLDVITPQSGVLKENRIEPFVGRWRSTWGNNHSPLSRSFPLPSRIPEYHCRHTRILDSEAFGHPSLDALSLPDGLFVCKDQEESVTSGTSDRPSSCNDLDLSWVCEEYGSEGSLPPTPAPQQAIAPLPPSSQPRSRLESATSQHQPGPASPSYTRHRDDEFDFDLEDIMVMEAIWQSIQDQGTRHKYTESEPPRMVPNQLTDLNTEFQEDADVGTVSEAKRQLVGFGARDHAHQSARMAGGLASAIAALAERHAIKGEAISALKQSNNIASPSEPEAIDEVGDLAVEADNHNFVPENRFSGRYGESGVVSGESDLHAMAVTLAIESGGESSLVSSSSETEQSDALVDSCCEDESFQQAEDGASTSTYGGYSNDALSNITTVNSPDVTINRCATDRKVMLPKSFEEQMMLAMALSLADAQSRAHLEDSHSRPLGQPIFE